MRRSSFYLLSLCVAMLMAGCQSSDNSLTAPQDPGHAMKKPEDPGGKPGGNELQIDCFEILETGSGRKADLTTGTDLVDGDNQPFVIDFTEKNSYRIHFHITYPEVISKVELCLYYDANVDYNTRFEPLEYRGYIRQEENVSGEKFLHWADGNLIPSGGSEHALSSNLSLLDQMATYNDNDAPVPDADHYGLWIWIHSGDREIGFVQLESFMWIQAPATDKKVYVESINMSHDTGKGSKITPKAEIKLNDELRGARLTYKWGGLLEDNYYYIQGPPYDVYPIVITGPDVQNNKSGEVTLTVKSVRLQDYVYDPENGLGNWPYVEPTGSLSIPVN